MSLPAVHALPAAPAAPPVVRIAPTRGLAALGLGDLWRHRELLLFLVWRDVKVRYKQTALGVAWAVLQPLATMVVFSLFFGRLARVPSDGVPYPLFALAALVPWSFFAQGVSSAAASVVGSQNLITKVWFPRLAIPLAAVLGGLVDLALSLVVLAALMARWRFVPTAAVVWLPAFLLLALATAIGAGLWLAALHVRWRDVRYVVPFLVQLWLFATPIAYPASLVPERWRALYGLNPMAGVVEGFRWALLGTATRPGPMLAASALAALALLVSGVVAFRAMERTFADVV